MPGYYNLPPAEVIPPSQKEACFITFAYRPKTVVKTLRAVSMQSPSAVAG